MELQFEKKPCRYLQRNVREVKDQEQTQEVKLPEGMPDIGTILGTWGQCVMRSKEWHEDGMNVAGGVMAWVLYAPADGSEPRSVEVWLPMQMKWSFPQSQREGGIRAGWLLKGVDARTLSARKMMVRANVSVLGEALEPQEEEISMVEQSPEDLQLLKNTYPARLQVEAGETTFLIDEEFEVGASEPAPAKLISYSFAPRITEQKVLGGKAVFRGVGMFHMLCQGHDGQLHSRDQEVSFSQFADLDRDYDKEARVDVMLALSSLEPELQEGRIRLKCGMIAQYLISDRVMLELVEDAYSTARKVGITFRELLLPMMLDESEETLRFDCTVPENASRVIDVAVFPQQPTVRRAGDLTEVECDGSVQVLFLDDTGALQGRNARWERIWELPAASDAEVLTTVMGMNRPQTSVLSGQINVSGEMYTQADTVSTQSLPMVTGLELGDAVQADPTRPSLILRRAGEGSLWEIAKNAGSTVNAIQRANGLTGEPVDDRILLIPVS